MNPDELMTEDEHSLVARLADICDEFAKIADNPKSLDLREAVYHLHALQTMVLSQAAARAFPDRYRLLGEGRHAGA